MRIYLERERESEDNTELYRFCCYCFRTRLRPLTVVECAVCRAVCIYA